MKDGTPIFLKSFFPFDSFFQPRGLLEFWFFRSYGKHSCFPAWCLRIISKACLPVDVFTYAQGLKRVTNTSWGVCQVPAGSQRLQALWRREKERTRVWPPLEELRFDDWHVNGRGAQDWSPADLLAILPTTQSPDPGGLQALPLGGSPGVLAAEVSPLTSDL